MSVTVEGILVVCGVIASFGTVAFGIWLIARLWQVGENERDIAGILHHLRLESGEMTNVLRKEKDE